MHRSLEGRNSQRRTAFSGTFSWPAHSDVVRIILSGWLCWDLGHEVESFLVDIQHHLPHIHRHFTAVETLGPDFEARLLLYFLEFGHVTH